MNQDRVLQRGCFALMAFVLLAAAFAPLAIAAPEKMASVEGITEYRLDNGLRVLLYRENSRPTVTINLTVLVGSRHEGYGETGMAHLLEHMLFKGTETHPKIFQLLTARGAQFNGSTSDDRTNYFETLPATDENLDFMISMEADRLVNCPIRAEDLSSEMTVVRNEFERGENSPRNVLDQRMFSVAYEWHNYGKSTIGNRSDIERVPVDSLRRFYKKFYQPDNAVVIVAGRFDTAKTLDLVQKYFGAIPKAERKLEQTYTEEPPQDGERMVTLRRVGDVPVVGLLYHVPAGPDPDFAAVDVLAHILSDQPAGVLYKALVETKKASSVSASAQPHHDPGTLMIMADVRPGQTPEEVRDAMFQAIDQLIEKGVSQEDVDRVRQRALKRREMLSSNTAQFAVSLSEWAAQGDWRLFFLFRDRIEKVTPKEVQAAAAKYLLQPNRTVGFFLPSKAPERVAVSATPDVAEMVKGYTGRGEQAAGEDFDASPANIEARTKITELPSGIKLALLPKKTRGQTVQLHLTLRYGTASNLKGLAEAADFLPDLMTRETTKLSRQALADALDKNNTSLGAGGGAGHITFNLQTKRANLPAALDLLRQVLREPALPGEELEIERRRALASLEQSRTQPAELVSNAIARKVLAYPADDVRYEPTFEEQIERAKAVSLAQVKTLYEQYLGAGHGEIVVVGDFDPDQVTAALTEALSNWEAKMPYERIDTTAPATLAAADEAILTPDRANAQYGAAFAYAVSDTHPDYPAMLMVNRILGGSGQSRLWVRVREKEGLSYGVRSYFSAGALDPFGELSISAIVNPTNMAKLKATIQEELKMLADDGVSLEELNKAKASYFDQQMVARSQDATLAGILAQALHAKRTIKFEAELEDKIRALTADQVSEAAKKYLDLNHLVIVTAGDFAAGGAKKDAENKAAPKK
jgi:zinc protease